MSSVVLATAGYDHTIRFWEATSGICYRTLQYADSQVNRLEITAEKSLVAAAGYGQIRLYEVNSNDAQPVFSYDGHVGNVTAVGFQKDSKWLFSGEEECVFAFGALLFFRFFCFAVCVCAARARSAEFKPTTPQSNPPPKHTHTHSHTYHNNDNNDKNDDDARTHITTTTIKKRGRGRHRARVGPARARLPARVRLARGRQQRVPAPEPGRADQRGPDGSHPGVGPDGQRVLVRAGARSGDGGCVSLCFAFFCIVFCLAPRSRRWGDSRFPVLGPFSAPSDRRTLSFACSNTHRQRHLLQISTKKPVGTHKTKTKTKTENQKPNPQNENENHYSPLADGGARRLDDGRGQQQRHVLRVAHAPGGGAERGDAL